MKRFSASLLLLLAMTLAFQSSAYARHYHSSHPETKQQKAMVKQARKQEKAQKKLMKQQNKAAKRYNKQHHALTTTG